MVSNQSMISLILILSLTSINESQAKIYGQPQYYNKQETKYERCLLKKIKKQDKTSWLCIYQRQDRTQKDVSVSQGNHFCPKMIKCKIIE